MKKSVDNKKSTKFSILGRRAEAPAITALMAAALNKPGLLSLAAGFTSNAMLPVEHVSSALDVLNKKGGNNPEYLQYGTTQGRPVLRQQVLSTLSAYSNESIDDYTSDNIIISNGSQQTLYLAIQVLCDPGDIVLVEKPSYFVFLELLKSRGVNAISIPALDNGDIDFPAFAELLDELKQTSQSGKVKACYLVSYFSNPSSHCMPEKDKKQLGDLLQAKDIIIPIIEDAAYRELYFDTPSPAPSILSVPELQAFPLLYTGTFTKPFSSGMKVGYGCCSDQVWLDKMLFTKGHHDFGTANFNQALMETVISQNQYESFLQKQRDYYSKKVCKLNDILVTGGLKELGWEWEMPLGGLFIWLKAPEYINTDMNSEFCQKAMENGVIYVPGNLCFAESAPHNYIRASFSAVPFDQMEEAGNRLIRTARSFSLI